MKFDRRSVIALVAGIICLHNSSAHAAVRFWDGGGTTGFWDTAANWSNNVAPANGDALFFPTNVARLVNTNRSSANLTNFDSIRFTGEDYNIFSVPFINLTNGLTNASSVSSANTFSAGLTLRRNQTWAVGGRNTLTVNSNVNWAGIFLTNDLDGTLIANGNWNGTAGAQLIKLGGGRLELNGAASSIPTVRVIDGTLQVDGALTAATSFVISNGASLTGTGSVSAFTCAGDFSPAGTSTPGLLTMTGAGNAVFAPGARFFANIDGLIPGTNHDQFKTPTPPNLSGATLLVLRSFSFNYAIGQKFIIITNTGAGTITTTFTSLAQNARITNSGVVFQISYTGGSGNDVELTVVDAPFAPSDVTRVWDGGSGSNNRNWSTLANWDNVLPGRGDDLVFPASAPSNTRINNNTLADTNAVFNRLWFGGQGITWIVRSNALKIFDGIVATNELPLGNASFDNAAVELIGPQTWSGTNMGITLNAPLLLGGHTLTLASETSSSVNIQEECLGPGTLVAAAGIVSFFSQVGASNVTVTISGASVSAGFGAFTGPPWQMSAGELRPGSAQLPGLQMTGGTLDLSGTIHATIAGNLTLAPAATVEAQFVSLVTVPTNAPLVVTGQVNLAGARLAVGPADLSLLGAPLKLIEKTSAGTVNGTFAGLPEAALFTATNEANGLVTLYRISYAGGNGNDVTLTPLLPTATGVTRVWTGAGADSLWPTVSNWSGNTPPATGDDAIFPAIAAQRVNTNTTPGLVLNAIEWRSSNYVHSGTLPLLSGLRHGAAGGTNEIVGALLVTYGENTWAVSNAAATLRVFQEPDNDPAIVAAAKGDAGIIGLGPVTKTGAGTLELENMRFGASGGLIVNGGTARLTSVAFTDGLPLVLQQGRVEAANVNATFVTATNGEMALLFVPDEDEGGVSGGMSAFGNVTLGSNTTLAVHWTNGAPAALRCFQLNLADARLDLAFPPALPFDEIIRVAGYGLGELSGGFANLPDGAVTNFGGRAWQIHYDVELPGADSDVRFITLEAPAVVPRFTSIERLPSGDVILRGTAAAGATVNIEASKLVESFVFIGSTVANAAGQFTFIDSPGALEQRFYRAAIPAP